MRNNFEKLYEYEFNLRKIAEQECFRNKALADKRLLSLNTWKRAAKKWWDEAEHRWNLWEAERSVHIRTQALADKRLVLLKRLEWVEYEPYSMVVYPEPKVWKECLICEHWFEHGHAPDCELAEAIDGV